MADIGSSLVKSFDYVWARFSTRLDGLSDQEYFWEPTPNTWTIRQDAGGRWRIDGDGGGGPPPDPLPVPTIAWRMGHIALTFIGFGDRRFGERERGLDDIDFAPTADTARRFVGDCYYFWRDGLVKLDELGWLQSLGPRFGAYAEDTTVDLALHVHDELVHHAAEVALLRDLYPHR